MSDVEFPLSRVVKGLKSHTGDKQVSLKVKLATEQLLQDVTHLVSKDLNRITRENKTITEKDLQRCTAPFISAIRMDQEHDEIVSSLQNIQGRMDNLVKGFRSKFDIKDEQNPDVWG